VCVVLRAAAVKKVGCNNRNCIATDAALQSKGKIHADKESHGMICAEDELGLGESHDGIMI
jgi:tRNA-binding EMAP/Myf-like protein